MLSFPFDSHITGKDPETQLPLMDRAVDSKGLQLYMERMFSSGIMPNIQDCFKVTPGTGMNISIRKGICMCGGAIGIDKRGVTKPIKPADSQDRIDAVIIRKDNTDGVRNIDFKIINGTPSSTPQPPKVTRPTAIDETSEIYDIVLAYVRVNKNTTSITTDLIQDKRYDGKVCGVSSPYNTVDTTGIFDQYESAFTNWFNDIKGQLSSDAAGNLQNQVNTLKNTTSKHTTEIANKQDSIKITSDYFTNAAIWGKIDKTQINIGRITENGNNLGRSTAIGAPPLVGKKIYGYHATMIGNKSSYALPYNETKIEGIRDGEFIFKNPKGDNWNGYTLSIIIYYAN